MLHVAVGVALASRGFHGEGLYMAWGSHGLGILHGLGLLHGVGLFMAWGSQGGERSFRCARGCRDARRARAPLATDMPAEATAFCQWRLCGVSVCSHECARGLISAVPPTSFCSSVLAVTSERRGAAPGENPEPLTLGLPPPWPP